MNGLLCVIAVFSLYVCALPCEAACFQNGAQTVTLNLADYQSLPAPTAFGPPIAASPCAANLASPYAASLYNGVGNGLYNGALNTLNFLRQRFVNGVAFQPAIVLKQVQPRVAVVKVKAVKAVKLAKALRLRG